MNDAAFDPDQPVLVLIPSFNDWEALGLLLKALDRTLDKESVQAHVLIVDDGSDQSIPDDLLGSYRTLSQITVLPLLRNLGHQRAIAVGLAYANDNLEARIIVVMDGDGEDDPKDVPRLVRACEERGGDQVVFAQRQRRSEGALFTLFYILFKILHRLLTGIKVEIGNFSAIPGRMLPRLVVVSELWNHYAAAVVMAKLPHAKLPTSRARRLAGRSRMNFVALVIHGLRAMSVFSEIVGIRLLIIITVLIAWTILIAATVVVIRYGTDLAIPEWATYTTGFLVIILLQAISSAIILSFITLGGRQTTAFIPSRDYTWFCGDAKQVRCDKLKSGQTGC